MSDLVGNPEDWFSHVAAYMSLAQIEYFGMFCSSVYHVVKWNG